MSDPVREHLVKALRGGPAYDTFEAIVREVPSDKRDVSASPNGRSAWQIVEHMRFSLEDIIEFSDNADGSYLEKNWPDDYWPKSFGPATASGWDVSVAGYLRLRARMESLVADPNRDLTAPFPWGDGQTLLREAILAIEHAAYHCGELVELTSCLRPKADV
jgi:DinB family protein